MLSINIKVLLDFIYHLIYFNTSNVINQLEDYTKDDNIQLFQYIKCYQSTIKDSYNFGGNTSFQYIKCYQSTRCLIMMII